MILVTGGAGYIGSITVEILINHGADVIVIDDLVEGNRSAVDPGAVFVQGNFGDRVILDDLFCTNPIEVVIHFAAHASVPLSMADPFSFYHNNVVNGLNLLDIMVKYGCQKMIFSSSAATFGEPEYIPIDENHPQKPINPYGETKLAFEKILHWYHKAPGLQVNSFRYFNASGATERLGESHKHESHLIPLAIQAALGKRDKLDIYGNDYPTKDGTCIRDFVHVVDIARAHILAISNLERRPHAAYNLGCGIGYTVKEVIDTFYEVSGLRVPFDYVGRRLGDPASLVASYDMAEAELGWQPLHDLRQIIESAWKWHQRYGFEYNEQTYDSCRISQPNQAAAL